jgi:hypothetical protein
MRRFAPIIVLLALLAVLAPASWAAAAMPKVRLVDCEPALDQAQRFAVFEGRMGSVKGAQRLQMRFTLQVRDEDAPRWHSVVAPGFGRWVSSNPGVSRYVYTKRVENLVAPAGYRALVRFRWLGAGGRRLASRLVTSPVCAQPDLRPNLRPLDIMARPAPGPGTTRYAIPVVNRGRSPAGGSELVLTVGGQALPIQLVEQLEAGERRVVSVEGPTCTPGSELTVDVDPSGAVDERDEADNRLTLPCPPALA